MEDHERDDWWSRDRSRPIVGDDRDDRDDELDDWDDLDDEATPDGLWGRYAGGGGWNGSLSPTSAQVASETVLRAHKMIQGFVNTFAPAGERYEVTFDATIATAVTDLRNRKVVISSAPLFDPTIDFAFAGRILMAMAAHEASHARYAKATAAAVRREWGLAPRPHRLGNLLEDVVIERSFLGEYPGGGDLFDPVIAYVAKASLVKHKLATFVPKLDDPLNLAISAVRYPDFTDWSDPAVALERDWYQGWAARATTTYSVREHVASIHEALQHMKDVTPPPPPVTADPPPDSRVNYGPSGEGEGEGETENPPPGDAGASDPSEGEGDAEPAESGAGTSAGQAEAPDLGANDPSEVFPTCVADAIEVAARQNRREAGEGGAPIDDYTAQESVRDTANLREAPDYPGARGEILWSHKAIKGRAPIDETIGNVAGGAIRSALMRSRTGHTAVERHLRRGSLDDRNLYRIADDNVNIFRKHRAPSPGNYRVWLMVDTSGSMSGTPIHDATNVAVALARATRSLPNVNLSIWGWTNGSAVGAHFRAIRVWTTGENVANIGTLERARMGGTPDQYVLSWASKAIKDELRGDEQPVIIFASDGAGYLNKDLVEMVRKRGVQVVSIALGYALGAAWQTKVYGEGGFIQWAGSILATAKPLGQLIGRIAAPKSHR